MGVVMSLTEELDGEVISLSLDDPAAFGRIYDRHASALATYLARRVANSYVETLLSDVFFAAFESRHRFDLGAKSALPWLYGIARNKVGHHHRSVERERRAEGRAASLRLVDVNSAPAIDEVVAETTLRASRLAAARDFIEAQNEADRELLLLYAWEELSYSEIAEAVDIPVGTVKSKLNRIRRALRKEARD